MRRATTMALCVAATVAITTCGDDDGPTPVDAGRQDAGPDRCLTTDPSEAAGLVGCNGGILGARPPNEYGGTCQAQIENPEDPRGTCDEGLVCYRSATSTRGLCLAICPEPPGGRFYTSTGGCPDGSRCFALGPMSLCFPDCRAGGDCSTGFCDPDNSCAVGTAPPDAGPDDAGGDDAGDDDAGGDDAGPLDAGEGDGGTDDAGPLDAGPLDAGAMDAEARDATAGDAASDASATDARTDA
ncbi:MAG: hypothetical protein IT379_34785 [Deltaproteobacteria bacterium]|nr:hypothetical protein [Deltaproteobacteria bacterium]